MFVKSQSDIVHHTESYSRVPERQGVRMTYRVDTESPQLQNAKRRRAQAATAEIGLLLVVVFMIVVAAIMYSGGFEFEFWLSLTAIVFLIVCLVAAICMHKHWSGSVKFWSNQDKSSS